MGMVYEMALVVYNGDKIGTVVDVDFLCHCVHVINIDTYENVFFAIEEIDALAKIIPMDTDNECFLRMINWCAITENVPDLVRPVIRGFVAKSLDTRKENTECNDTINKIL